MSKNWKANIESYRNPNIQLFQQLTAEWVYRQGPIIVVTFFT